MSELSYDESESERSELLSIKDEFLSQFRRLYLYQLEFERGLHKLSIQKNLLEDQIHRLEELESHLPENNVFTQQPVSRDFSFSNPGTENTTFSFGEVDENIEVGSVYHNQVDLETMKKIDIKFIYQPRRTGYELTREFPAVIGEIIAERYRIDRIIANTDISLVLECADLVEKRKTCIKVVENDKRCLDRGIDEIRILSNLKQNCEDGLYQNYICNLYDYFYYKEHLFISLELLGETLANLLSNEESAIRLKEQIKPITVQILKALKFFNTQKLIHGDLSPDNILQVNKPGKIDIRIIDFNSSSYISDSGVSGFPKLSYTAPELINGNYVEKSDMWSLGCIVAEIHLGKPLFSPNSEDELLYQIQEIIGAISDLDLSMHAEYKFTAPLSDSITDDPRLLDFLHLLLSPNPDNRPSPSEALEHT